MKPRTFKGLFVVAMIVLAALAFLIVGILVPMRRAMGNTLPATSSEAISVTLEVNEFIPISNRGYITVTLTNNTSQTLSVDLIAINLQALGIGGCCTAPVVTPAETFCGYLAGSDYRTVLCGSFDFSAGEVVTITLSPFFNTSADVDVSAAVHYSFNQSASATKHVFVGYNPPTPTATPNFWLTPSPTPQPLRYYYLPHTLR